MSMMRVFGSASAAAFFLLPAAASANDELVRGLIGIGSAIILNQAQQEQQRRLDNHGAKIDSYRRASKPNRYAPPGARAQGDGGGTRQQRAEIQRRLNALGYDAGQPDGVYGPRTRSAIARFQASLGRSPDGILSQAEVSALYAATGSAMPGATTFDGGGAAGFPQLGEAPAEAGTGEAGSFPALGSAGENGPAEAAFPKLGSARPDSPADTAGAFPALGAPADASSSGDAFPTLGKASPQTTEDGAMPALAVPSDSGGMEFPTLTNAPLEPTEAALPAIAPAPDQQDAAFPKTARPATAEDPAMPALAPSMPEAEDAMPKLGNGALPVPNHPAAEEATLDEEIARTIYGERKAQPAVAGVSLGQTSEEALAALRKNGFPSCDSQASSVNCSRTTDRLKDTVMLWVTADGVWAVRRSIEFTSPAPADFVMQQFRAAYPKLLAEPRRAVTSGQVCHAAELPDMGIASLLGRMDKVLSAGDEQLPADIVGYAQTCPLIYMIGFEGAETISAARLTFIDATPFIRRGVAELREREAREKVDREKLSEDLKL